MKRTYMEFKGISPIISDKEKLKEIELSNSIHNVGLMYEEGNEKLGIKSDFKMALHWYEKGAELGERTSLFKIGLFYDTKYESLGIKRDLYKAIEFYEKASNLGHNGASFNLALTYEEGDVEFDIPIDIEKAFNYYFKSCDQGNSDAIINLYVLCSIDKSEEVLRMENFISKQRPKVISILTNFADVRRDPECLFTMGRLYYNGGTKFNFTRNVDIAIDYFKRAAQLNHPRSMGYLGDIYSNGATHEKNMIEAIKYYERGVELNNLHSMNKLGHLCESGGLHFQRNIIRAIELQEKYIMNSELIIDKETLKDKMEYVICLIEDMDYYYFNHKMEIKRFLKRCVMKFEFSKNSELSDMVTSMYDNFVKENKHNLVIPDKIKNGLREENKSESSYLGTLPKDLMDFIIKLY